MQFTPPHARTQLARQAFAAVWVEPPNSVHPTGTVKVTVGRTWGYYDVVELECQFPECCGFSVVKRSELREQYHMLLGRNGQDFSCECKGFYRWGAPCRHIKMLWSVTGGQSNA